MLYRTTRNKRFMHSAKRNYSSIIQLSDIKNKKIKYFPLFRDSEIGITEYWQINLIESVIIFLTF